METTRTDLWDRAREAVHAAVAAPADGSPMPKSNALVILRLARDVLFSGRATYNDGTHALRWLMTLVVDLERMMAAAGHWQLLLPEEAAGEPGLDVDADIAPSAEEGLRLAQLEAALHTLCADLRAAGEDDALGDNARSRFHRVADGLAAAGFAPLSTGAGEDLPSYTPGD